MAGNKRFTYEDVIALKALNGVFEKVDEVFNEIKKPLEEKFGRSIGGVRSTDQIRDHGRLSIYCQDILGTAPSEVLVGFNFKGSKAGEGPVVSVHLWLGHQNESFDKLKSIFQEDEKTILNTFKTDSFSFKEELGIGLIFEKPLADFLEVDDQLSSITKWINQRLDDFDEFRENYPDLDWNQDLNTTISPPTTD